MKTKNIKIRLEKVSRTDLICIACGNFRTEWAIVPAADAEPQAGVHTKCIPTLHVRHTRKTSSSAPTPKDGVDAGTCEADDALMMESMS